MSTSETYIYISTNIFILYIYLQHNRIPICSLSISTWQMHEDHLAGIVKHVKDSNDKYVQANLCKTFA